MRRVLALISADKKALFVMLLYLVNSLMKLVNSFEESA